MGIDTFFNGLVCWPKYLADWTANILPGTPQQMMYGVSVVEILAGTLVALKPRYAAYVVAAWLAGIAINLFSARPPRIGVARRSASGVDAGTVRCGRISEKRPRAIATMTRGLGASEEGILDAQAHTPKCLAWIPAQAFATTSRISVLWRVTASGMFARTRSSAFVAASSDSKTSIERPVSSLRVQ